LLLHGRPRHLVLFGALSLGDDVLCTAIFRELARRGEKSVWMMSRHPDIFRNNPDVARVVPVDEYHALTLQKLGTHVVRPYYFKPGENGRLIPPPRPIIAQACFLAGIRGQIELRPWIHLSPGEKNAGRLADRQVVMHTSGAAAKLPMANKDWIAGRFEEVATALSRDQRVIQLGAPGDPPLSGAVDLRGKTTLRQSAAIVSASRFVVCQEGFLMHLARAVDTPSVVLYGGFALPSITGYSANENLRGMVECAPCWLPNDCPFGMKCMDVISSDDVIAAVGRLESRLGKPLSVDTCTL
jgi:ADP-heptose:LPS heptosyltransferase